jgi:polyisoprenoid-binding protein YceI
MRKNVTVWAMLLGLIFTVQVQAAEELKLDAEKSKIEFVGSKPDGKHAGGFKKFDVTAKADFENPTKSELKIVIETDSLYSDDEKLTNHLKNPDFFNVRKYPKITFESTKVETVNDNEAKIHGKLTMLDRTVEVVVPCKVEHEETKLSLKVDFKIDRTKWGMTYGEGKINKEVDIKASLVFKL